MKSSYKIGQTVYMKVGDQIGLVTGILLEPGAEKYRVSWDDASEGYHYEFELTENKEFKT